MKNFSLTLSTLIILLMNTAGMALPLLPVGEDPKTDNFPGTALEFDGDNDYVSIPSDDTLNTLQFSVDFWVRTDNPGQYQGILDKGRSTNSDWYFLTTASGNTEGVIFGIGNGTSRNEISYSWNDTEWHHVAGTYDGTTMKLYVDGYLKGAETYSYSSTINNIVIGSRRDQTYHYDGKLDEISIWDDARTINEIRNNMHLSFDQFSTGILGYWQFNDGSGTIAADSISYNHGTLHNMNNSDWVTSTIPFGGGWSNAHIVSTTGSFVFNGLTMNVTAKTGTDTIVTTRIDTVPNLDPPDAFDVFDHQYWVINQYGGGTLETNLTFSFYEDLTSVDESNPYRIKLYTRAANSDGEWTYLASATSVSASGNTATFEGITGFSQFLAGRANISHASGHLPCSANWTDSTFVDGDVFVDDGCTLTIDPGVYVEFQGFYKLDVQGRLLAEGSSSDSITFSVADTAGYHNNTHTGWNGISFDETPATNDTSKISYCKLEFGKQVNGGALYAEDVNKMLITNSRFSNNFASGDWIFVSPGGGGAIYLKTSYITLSDNTITHNETDGSGGGIFIDDFDTPPEDTLLIGNNEIAYNTAHTSGFTDKWGGGGIFYFLEGIYGLDYLTEIKNNHIHHNTSDGLGGAYSSGNGGGYSSLAFHMSITGNRINDNTADKGGGLAVVSGNWPLEKNIIVNNSATSYGGGLYYVDVDLVNNVISGNQAADGAGIWFNRDAYGTNHNNNTICNNSATNNGGGINIYSGSSGFSPAFTNNIIFGNSATNSGSQVYIPGDNFDPGFFFCNVEGDTAAFAGLGSGTNFGGNYENCFDKDPCFSGNALHPYSLTDSSLCVNTGIQDTSGLHLPGHDVAGNDRIFDGIVDRIDVGAYEYQGNPELLIFKSYPEDNDELAQLDTIKIWFNYPVAAQSGYLSIYYEGGTLLEQIDITNTAKVNIDTNYMSIVPANAILSGYNYYILIDNTAISDLSATIYHSGFYNNTDWNFTLNNTDPFPGDALEFDGVDDCVSILSNASFNTPQFTVEFWVAANNPGQWQGIIDKGTNTNSDWYFVTANLGNTEGVTFGIGNGSSTQEISYSWNDTLWHHVAGTYDGTFMKLYVDGCIRGEESHSYSNTTNNIMFGSRRNQSWFFEGKLDEIAIWNDDMSVGQIRENMHLNLTGSEQHLVAYWQLNESSGVVAIDTINANNGTLNNMSDDDWIASTIPMGGGASNTQIVNSTGIVDFTSTGLSLDFISKTGTDTIVVTRIDTVANIYPKDPEIIFSDQYWVVNQFGSGAFEADLTFTLSEDLTSYDEENPVIIALYTRVSTSDTAWHQLMTADSVNAANKEITFEGVTAFSQFIIGRLKRPMIAALKYPLSFSKITWDFNSIDVGERSKPSFSDLDGDGLLDLIIGEKDGNLNHWEQESENSTSFSQITSNFNSIDVGEWSAPRFIDLDGDRLLDLIIGEYDGNLNHWEQESKNSNVFSLVTENFNSIDVGNISSPAFIDIDNDGLLDMIIGKEQGGLSHYEQNSINSTSFSVVTYHFNSIDVGNYSFPSFTDLGGDGLLDLIIGESDGNLNHYRQDTLNSSSFSLVTNNFNSIDVGIYSVPYFTDLDGDGLLDLTIGEFDGNLNHWEQDGTPTLACGDVFVGDTSNAQSYFIKCTDLVDDLTIECPDHFEVSLSEQSGYVQNLSISPINGTISDTLYVRFETTVAQQYTGDIVHTSDGAETKNISVSGAGVYSIDNFPGTALVFDGENDYVSLPSDSLFTTVQFTVEFWVAANNPGNWEGILDKGTNSNTDWYFVTGNPGQTEGIIFGIGNGNSKNEIAYSWNDTLWHHIAGMYDGTSMKLYVDGQFRASSICSYSSSVNNIVFGSRRNQSWYFEGKLDEVRVWDNARTEQEVRENMYLVLTGHESGLLSYWQFNNGSGDTLRDAIHIINGTLNNMSDDNWIESTIPFGGGARNTQIVSATGNVVFTGTGLSMDFIAKTGTDTIVSCRIDTVPNIDPEDPETVFDEQYWVVNQFGGGSFEADLTFTLSDDLTSIDEANPGLIALYTRASNADTAWVRLITANSVNAASNEVTFPGITAFSQFVICRLKKPMIVPLEFPFNFTEITVQFNSIDVGMNAAPCFADLDGDNLLDLIIGEKEGYMNLNRWEQNSVNSTSFHFVTKYFNYIYPGWYISPTFTDLDNDGLLDLILGESDGVLTHWEQNNENSTSFSSAESLNSVDVGQDAVPAFADLDGDGLLDLIVGESYGNLNHWEQDAKNSISFSVITNQFNSIDVGESSAPRFTDLDGDGLLDLIIGESNGNLNHWKQDEINSTSFSLITENFYSIDVGDYSNLSFTDIDGDGLLDMIIGEKYGSMYHFEQDSVPILDFLTLSGGTSAAQNYYIKCVNFVDDLLIECPNGFKASLNEHSGYVQNLSISHTDTRISDTIFIRFEPDAVQQYNGVIAHSSCGAETSYVNVTGTATDPTDNYPGTTLEFDGGDDYISIPSDNSLNTNQFTVEFWVAANNPGQWQGIIDKGRIANTDWFFLTAASGQTEGVIFGIGNGTSFEDINYSWNDSLWHHVAGTYNGDILKLYVDGHERGSETFSYSSTSNNIVIGSRREHDWPFEGKIDEVRIWDFALDSIQIRENMHLTLTGSESGLVSYWQFNNGSGSTLSDVVGGNDGTLNNMTNDDWIESTVATGGGESDTQTETAGTVDFTGTGLSMYYNSQNGASVTVTRIDTTPNMNPTGQTTVFDDQYWVVNRFGSGTFDAGLTFTISENLTSADETNPSNVKLFARASNADTSWAFLTSASSVSAANDEATFNGISGFSQFIITSDNTPEEIVISSDTLSSGADTCYFAQKSIEAPEQPGSYFVQSGATATFIADSSIKLLPGFHADNGCYFHAYIGSEGCPVAPATMVSVEPIEVFSELADESDIIVYPNPTTGIVNIKMTNPDYDELVYLEVYNNVGVRIYDRRVITQSNSSINLSHYPPGLYIFKVQYQDKIELLKVIRF